MVSRRRSNGRRRRRSSRSKSRNRKYGGITLYDQDADEYLNELGTDAQFETPRLKTILKSVTKEIQRDAETIAKQASIKMISGLRNKKGMALVKKKGKEGVEKLKKDAWAMFKKIIFSSAMYTIVKDLMGKGFNLIMLVSIGFFSWPILKDILEKCRDVFDKTVVQRLSIFPNEISLPFLPGFDIMPGSDLFMICVAIVTYAAKVLIVERYEVEAKKYKKTLVTSEDKRRQALLLNMKNNGQQNNQLQQLQLLLLKQQAAAAMNQPVKTPRKNAR